MALQLVSSKVAERMPCPLLSLSVMHSGTRFFADLLHPSHVKHLHQDTAIEKIIDRAGTVYCTIRKPEDVLHSWYKRNNGRIRVDGDPNDQWAKSWKVLADLSARYPIWFLPIDHPDRDDYLQRLARHLKREIAPDWNNVIGASGGAASVPDRIKTDWIYDSLPIVRELYGQPKRASRRRPQSQRTNPKGRAPDGKCDGNRTRSGSSRTRKSRST